MWLEAIPLSFEWIDHYKKEFERQMPEKVAEFPGSYITNKVKNALEIEPNKMQQTALQGIQKIREKGETRSLIISATGTGKTYLAAFDVRKVKPKRMLFIVHREQILKKAKLDFMQVLGGNESDFGILSGTNHQIDATYLFATVQTMSKESTLQLFDPECFDYILIDESHRAGAGSYQRIIDYFKPSFLMGMTATPERSDGYDLFKLFNYNIAYEIRLQEALEEDMLTPFHYYGVTDLEIDGEVKDVVLFNKLISEERVTRILEKLDYYGFSGDRVRGLIFCSTKKEAHALSEIFNQHGFRTVPLTGEDSQEKRMREVSRLENGDLDYILTVDIFNEGIDIPCINQVVMLRQTQSSIIFIQQLGRGLRKHDSKEHLTVIDFIGNYSNNYLIPIALSGDYSQNKDSIRRKMIDTSYIKGTSSVNFEAIAKERIYEAIKTAKLTHMKVFRDAYKELKNRIGRMPLLIDFFEHHSIDPVVIANKKNNYVDFLKSMREDISDVSSEESKLLTFITQEILSGKRQHEAILITKLLEMKHLEKEEYVNILNENDLLSDSSTIHSIERILELSFFTEVDQKKYGQKSIIINNEGVYELSDSLKRCLESKWFRTLFEDVLKVAFRRTNRYKKDSPLTRLEKYSRKDVCKLLNWEKDEHSTMYGYKTKRQTCPIFVTYHKEPDVEASVNYEDTFLSPEVLHWFTRSRRRKTSKEVVEIIESQKRDVTIHIFVKKDDDEGNDFYYLGEALPDQNSVEETTMPNDKGEELPVVTMDLLLKDSVDQPFYDYLHENMN